MSAPESLKRLRQMGHGAASGTENTPKLSRERRMMSPSEKSTNNSRLSGSCADLPKAFDAFGDDIGDLLAFSDASAPFGLSLIHI